MKQLFAGYKGSAQVMDKQKVRSVHARRSAQVKDKQKVIKVVG